MPETTISQEEVLAGSRRYAEALRDENGANFVRGERRKLAIKELFKKEKFAQPTAKLLEQITDQFAQILADEFMDDRSVQSLNLDKTQVTQIFQDVAKNQREYVTFSADNKIQFNPEHSLDADTAMEQHAAYIGRILSQEGEVDFTELTEFLIESKLLVRSTHAPKENETAEQLTAQAIGKRFSSISPKKLVKIQDALKNKYGLVDDVNKPDHLLANSAGKENGEGVLELCTNVLKMTNEQILEQFKFDPDQILFLISDKNPNKIQQITLKSAAFLGKAAWGTVNTERGLIKDDENRYTSERNPLLTSYSGTVEAANAKIEVLKDIDQAYIYILRFIQRENLKNVATVPSEEIPAPSVLET